MEVDSSFWSPEKMTLMVTQGQDEFHHPERQIEYQSKTDVTIMVSISGSCGRPGEGGEEEVQLGRQKEHSKWWDLFKIRLQFGAVFDNLF